MSGGHFDNRQYVIDDIADSIEDYLYGHELDESEAHDYIEDVDCDDDEADYVTLKLHTMPNRYKFRFKTLQEMKRAVKCLRTAAVYAQRIDFLLSGEDGEESFIERLVKDLKAVRQGREVDFSK